MLLFLNLFHAISVQQIQLLSASIEMHVPPSLKPTIMQQLPKSKPRLPDIDIARLAEKCLQIQRICYKNRRWTVLVRTSESCLQQHLTSSMQNYIFLSLDVFSVSYDMMYVHTSTGYNNNQILLIPYCGVRRNAAGRR